MVRKRPGLCWNTSKGEFLGSGCPCSSFCYRMAAALHSLLPTHAGSRYPQPKNLPVSFLILLIERNGQTSAASQYLEKYMVLFLHSSQPPVYFFFLVLGWALDEFVSTRTNDKQLLFFLLPIKPGNVRCISRLNCKADANCFRANSASVVESG